MSLGIVSAEPPPDLSSLGCRASVVRRKEKRGRRGNSLGDTPHSLSQHRNIALHALGYHHACDSHPQDRTTASPRITASVEQNGCRSPILGWVEWKRCTSLAV